MPRQHSYYVYMLTGCSRRALYVGVTNDLQRRLTEHREYKGNSFTARYKLDRLVYYEHFNHIDRAISREKELKGWTRAKKDALIRGMNPE